jgi:hypothetical protein
MVDTPITSAAKRAEISFSQASVRRHQHLAAHVAALLDGSQLVFEVHAGGARSDHVLHQFEGVQHAAEAGFGVGHDRQEVVDELLVARVDATAPLDFVGARKVLLMRRTIVGTESYRVQRLVGVHGLGRVAVGGDLPARQVHGFQAGLGLLHGLAGGDRAEAFT